MSVLKRIPYVLLVKNFSIIIIGVAVYLYASSYTFELGGYAQILGESSEILGAYSRSVVEQVSMMWKLLVFTLCLVSVAIAMFFANG